MVIAVDFDGTIVEHRYPQIGKEIPFAIDTLKMLAKDRHQLILWTVREGKRLEEAVEWCKKNAESNFMLLIRITQKKNIRMLISPAN